MDIRVLKNFMKIAEQGSICKAAESLHISQPPLSRQLKSLEDELDIKIFERSPKGVQLTEKGHLLYKRAASLISYNDLIIRELTTNTDIIRVGVTTSLVEYALGYVKEFSKDNSVYFEFTEKNTFELLELLKNIMLDMVFIRTPFEFDSQFTSAKLADDCLVAIGDPYFFSDEEKETISLHQLQDTPIITVRRWKNYIDFAAESDERTSLDYHFICDDNRTAFSMAQGGMGVAILPGSITNFSSEKTLLTKEIQSVETLKSDIYIVFPAVRTLEPAASEFVNFIMQNPQNL